MADGVAANSSSSSSSSSSDDEPEQNDEPLGATEGIEINVEISEKKNEIPLMHAGEHAPIRVKADNDMESSDLGFSEDHPVVDEHAYQIERTGQFEMDNSISDRESGGINREMSVDFSEGGLSYFSDFSHEAEHGSVLSEDLYSSEANDMSENFLSSFEDYSESRPQQLEDEDDWSRFMEDEHRYGRHGKPARNTDSDAPAAGGSSQSDSDSQDKSSDSSSMSSSSSSSSSVSS